MRSKRVITVVGCHAAGEVGDVIVGGVLPPAGATMFEKMRTFEREHDHIRQMLIQEPRGSVARHVNLIVPSTRTDCQAGAIIMEPTEYPPMSGSNTICIVTVLLETGLLPMVEPVTTLHLDMPAGVVEVRASCREGKVEQVEFDNVPAFALKLGARLEIEGIGTISVDIAYGGMLYAIADAQALGFGLEPSEAKDLSQMGEQIRQAAREQLEVVHPENPEIRGVSIVQIAQPFQGVGQVSRSAVSVAPGRLDRSPTGTALSARLAVLHAKGQMQVGQHMIQESVIGSRFVGRIKEVSRVGNLSTIIPTIQGQAWITGLHQYFVDPTDPFPSGYVLSDTWGVSGKTSQD
jgi:trans-L-3-hydroxyproline dehydratase